MSGEIRSTKWMRALKLAAAAVLGLVVLGACAHLMMMMRSGIERPPAEEFGFGPRSSAGGVYQATLEPAGELGTRRMHSAKLVIRTGQAPVAGAAIQVDGGMPQHGHGLPTAPRVTRDLGNGEYQVDGLRFNMPGWWELKFRVASPAGTDSVTFNLAL